MTVEVKPKDTDWKVANRWTPKLGKHFTPVSDFFLENYTELGITTTQAMLIIHLMTHKWTEKNPFPGYKLLGKKMGMTDKQVRTHAAKLQADGFLIRIFREGFTNEFDLTPLFAALEELMSEQAKSEKANTKNQSRRS
jgi:hypothetical protein